MKMDRFHTLEEDPTSGRTLISGSRNDAVFPPRLAREKPGMSLEENEPNSLDPDVSLDYLSLLQPEDNASVVISGSNREASTDCLLKTAPEQNSAEYAPCGQEDISYQQALIAAENNESKIHKPEQDTSPHLSLEEGNSTCLATSESTKKSQKEYKRLKPFTYPAMARYADRLNTFIDFGWSPLGRPSAEELAKAGMFYQGPVTDEAWAITIYDQVVCFKCGQTIREWKPNDIPIEEHKNISYNCCLTKWEDEP